MSSSRIFAFIVIACTATAAAATQRQLKTHVHGHGTLNIAIEGNKIAMELDAPQADIMGFEHLPNTADEKAVAEQAEALLKRGQDLFVLTAAAGCKLEAAEFTAETETEHHAEAHDGPDEDHRDYNVTYTLTCADPASIGTIHFNYFNIFPAAKALTVNMIGEAGQSSHEVLREHPDLNLKKGM